MTKLPINVFVYLQNINLFLPMNGVFFLEMSIIVTNPHIIEARKLNKKEVINEVFVTSRLFFLTRRSENDYCKILKQSLHC